MPHAVILPQRLQDEGWSAKPYDICWEACSEPGYRLADYGNWEIVLCVEHILELEETAEDGYSTAEPPASSPNCWWPWRNTVTGEFEE